jgi:hypothetical protein
MKISIALFSCLLLLSDWNFSDDYCVKHIRCYDDAHLRFLVFKLLGVRALFCHLNMDKMKLMSVLYSRCKMIEN